MVSVREKHPRSLGTKHECHTQHSRAAQALSCIANLISRLCPQEWTKATGANGQPVCWEKDRASKKPEASLSCVKMLWWPGYHSRGQLPQGSSPCLKVRLLKETGQRPGACWVIHMLPDGLGVTKHSLIPKCPAPNDPQATLTHCALRDANISQKLDPVCSGLAWEHALPTH